MGHGHIPRTYSNWNQVPARFNNLRGGSVARIKALRASAEKLAASPRLDSQSRMPTWRTVRYSTFSQCYPDACMGTNTIGYGRFARTVPIIATQPNADALPVRSIKFADEVGESYSRCIDHKGWYSDSEGRETVRGIVASLSHGRFLAGYVWSSNDEHVLFLDEIFSGEDAEKEAARRADSHAETYAESCREDSDRFDAMKDAEIEEESAAGDIGTLWRRYRVTRTAWIAKPEVYARDLGVAIAAVHHAIDVLREKREALQTATRAYENGGA